MTVIVYLITLNMERGKRVYSKESNEPGSERTRYMYGVCSAIMLDVSFLKASFDHFGLVVPHHLLQTHPDGPPRLPIKDLLGPCGIGPPPLRVVGGNGLVDDVNTPIALHTILVLDLLHDFTDELSKLTDSEFVAVTDVDGTRLVRVHESDHAVDEIMNVLERTRLLTVTVDRHVLAFEGLDDEVGDNTAVEGVH